MNDQLNIRGMLQLRTDVACSFLAAGEEQSAHSLMRAVLDLPRSSMRAGLLTAFYEVARRERVLVGDDQGVFETDRILSKHIAMWIEETKEDAVEHAAALESFSRFQFRTGTADFAESAARDALKLVRGASVTAECNVTLWLAFMIAQRSRWDDARALLMWASELARVHMLAEYQAMALRDLAFLQMNLASRDSEDAMRSGPPDTAASLEAIALIESASELFMVAGRVIESRECTDTASTWRALLPP